MATELGKLVYKRVNSFCKNNGYFDALEKSLKISEGERFDKKDLKFGLDILDAVHCVADKNRSLSFIGEIMDNVRPGDRVIEAGSGTGLLSFVAAACGADVIGLEINPKIADLSRKIQKYLSNFNDIDAGGLNFVEANAIKYIPDQKVDAVISENIYTGMFYEKQVQIMNHLVKYLKNRGVVVPLGLKMGVIAVNAGIPKSAESGDLFVPDQLGGKLKVHELSQSAVYSELNFTELNSEFADKTVDLKVLKDGEANSVLIWTEVIFCNNILGRKDTTFLNSDIVIALPDPVVLKKGQTARLKIKYKFGSKPKDAKFIFMDH